MTTKSQREKERIPVSAPVRFYHVWLATIIFAILAFVVGFFAIPGDQEGKLGLQFCIAGLIMAAGLVPQLIAPLFTSIDMKIYRWRKLRKAKKIAKEKEYARILRAMEREDDEDYEDEDYDDTEDSD